MRGINYDPSDYFMQMNHFFNRIEEKLSCKVIIAGHPAVEDRQSYCTYFNGRKVVYDNTMVLIKILLQPLLIFQLQFLIL